MGMMKEPESNDDVDECIRFFYETLRYRKLDYNSGFYDSVTPDVIDRLYEIEPTRLHVLYLYYILPTLDNEYARYISKLQQEAQKNSAKK